MADVRRRPPLGRAEWPGVGLKVWSRTREVRGAGVSFDARRRGDGVFAARLEWSCRPSRGTRGADQLVAGRHRLLADTTAGRVGKPRSCTQGEAESLSLSPRAIGRRS